MTYIEQFERDERRRNVAFFVWFHIAMAAEAIAAFMLIAPAICR